LLTLELFGYYSLAATVAGVCYLLVAPVTTAVFPSLVKLSTLDERAALARLYHQGAQLVTALTAPAALLLSCYAAGVIYLWSGNAGLAQNTAPILFPLVLGSFLNGLMWIPYQCQLAHGQTGLVFKVNLAGAAVLVPALFWIVPRYGAVGAAWIWVAVNAGFVLISIHFMHRELVTREKWKWYFADVLLPLIGALAVVLLAGPLQPAGLQDRWQWLIYLTITGGLALAASAAMADLLRSRLIQATRGPSGDSG
jgi:O-antigen/teichoic acid export membrane protein